MAGVLIGVVVGFLLPPLAAYTCKIQRGLNLYNMGFACGILALILVSLMSAFGAEPTTAHYWSTGHNLFLGIVMAVLCCVLILSGLLFAGRSPKNAWISYQWILYTSGRFPSDYLQMFGAAPVLLNVGLNGLLATALILLTGGDLNGPTIGGILSIMGFSAFGKHARNIVPVMLGVVLGGGCMKWGINHSSVQLAMLFGTTLAPISGCYGWPFGLLAGFLHSAVVLHAGTPVEGVNLYNNGFSGGLIAIVLYPILTTAFGRTKLEMQAEDYFEGYEGDLVAFLTKESR